MRAVATIEEAVVDIVKVSEAIVADIEEGSILVAAENKSAVEGRRSFVVAGKIQDAAGVEAVAIDTNQHLAWTCTVFQTLRSEALLLLRCKYKVRPGRLTR